MPNKHAIPKSFWSAPSDAVLAWTSSVMPFVFILPALYIRFNYLWLVNNKSYEHVFQAALWIELGAPIIGLVLAALAMRSRMRLGKIAATINILAIGYNILWLHLLPYALSQAAALK
jgi:hypothetical protein